MGAKIINNLHDYCLLITNKVGNEAVSKAKKMKGIKVLKPEFITDCKQCNALMA